ncbi:MAG: hypothetical protein IKF52_01875 [Clostridia bacterium]|nr:hypothetical protein [Clostridia bacterium]
MLKNFLGKRKIEIIEVSEKDFDEFLDDSHSPQIISEIKRFISNRSISKYYFGYKPGERRVYKVECIDGEVKTWDLSKKSSRRKKHLFFIF